MNRNKLTEADKRGITADWQACFPSLGVYRPMHLLNRAGPLLMGILLDVKSGGDDYTPVLHTHALMRPFPVVYLGMKRVISVMNVNIAQHRNALELMREEVRKEALLPFGDDLVLRDVIAAYREHLLDPRHSRGPYHGDIEDMILLAGWGADRKLIDETIDFARRYVADWPEGVLSQLGGTEVWFARLREQTMQRDALVGVCTEQIRTLGLERIPVRMLSA